MKYKFKCIQNYIIILCIIQQVERGHAGESSIGTRKLNKLDDVNVLSWLMLSIGQSVINLTNDKNKFSPNVQYSLKVKYILTYCLKEIAGKVICLGEKP